MITLEDLKKLTVKELKKELEVTKKNLFKVRLDIVSGQEKKNNLVKEHKRHIARMNTLINEKLYKMAYSETTEEPQAENNSK